MTAIHVPSEMATTPAIVHVHQHTPHGKQTIPLSPRSLPKVASDGVGVIRHLQDEIRQRAHKIWMDKGNPDGFANWIAAERELHQEAVQRYSKKTSSALQLHFQLDVAQSKKAHLLDLLQEVDKEIADLNDQIAHHDPENPVRHLGENLHTPEKPFINDKDLVPHLDKNPQTPEKPFTNPKNLIPHEDQDLQTPEKLFTNHKNLVPHLDTDLQTPEKPFMKRRNSQLVELDFQKETEEPFKQTLFNDNTQAFQEDFTTMLKVFKTATVVNGKHEIVIKLAED